MAQKIAGNPLGSHTLRVLEGMKSVGFVARDIGKFHDLISRSLGELVEVDGQKVVVIWMEFTDGIEGQLNVGLGSKLKPIKIHSSLFAVKKVGLQRHYYYWDPSRLTFEKPYSFITNKELPHKQDVWLSHGNGVNTSDCVYRSLQKLVAVLRGDEFFESDDNCTYPSGARI